MSDQSSLVDPVNPVSWEPSATGDRFPIRVNMSHPLWQTFLDSGSISPLHFFRAFLAPPSYFQSPTPWNQGNRRRVAQKVAELLDSFRPGGTYCYRPFYKGFKVYRNDNYSINDDNNNNTINQSDLDNNNNNNSNNNDESTAVRNLAANANSEPRVDNNFQENGNPSRFVASEDARRRLYLDLDRPRPFYGRTSFQNRREPFELNNFLVQDSVRHSDPKSLQDCAKISLIHHFGLPALNLYLCGDLFTSEAKGRPPLIIRDRILTLSSDDFQEIIESASDGESCKRQTGTFKVRCIHDEQTYVATFFTSEMDKAVSNLWEEFGHHLRPRPQTRPMKVLALAADPLTENVFLISKNHLDFNVNNLLNSSARKGM